MNVNYDEKSQCIKCGTARGNGKFCGSCGELLSHAVNSIVFDAVARFGGSFSAEHGIGSLKREELALRKSPVALQLMRSIKAALDPLGLMNPGRVL